MTQTFESLGIDNLRFFTGDGNEIVMTKDFSASWEIIPDSLVWNAFYKRPSGHIELHRTEDVATPKAILVVDEPGQVYPSVTFTRSAHDYDYVFSYREVSSADGIVVAGDDNDAPYVEISGDGHYHTIDNVFDILFFGYKVEADNDTDYRTNTLRLTINDGVEVRTEDYSLLDLLRCSL